MGKGTDLELITLTVLNQLIDNIGLGSMHHVAGIDSRVVVVVARELVVVAVVVKRVHPWLVERSTTDILR